MSTNTEKPASDTLNELLTRAYDAEKGYEVAGESTEHSGLKEYFLKNSKQRREFGGRLKGLLSDLDVEPDKGTSVEGKLHQAFIKLRSFVGSDNDLALIEECRRGEETAMLDYKEALENGNLRTDAETILRDQATHILDQLTALESIEAALRKG